MNRAIEEGEQLIVLGAGGHARSLLGLLSALGRPATGCISPVSPKARDWPLDECPWLGDDAALEALDPTRVHLVNGLGSIACTALRRTVYQAARTRGFKFPPLVHPSAILAEGIQLADGVQVMAGVIAQPGVALAENTLLNTGCIVDHDTCIGAHSHLAPGVTISGGVVVGNDVHVGTAAVVIQGVHIGSNVVVGAGSVVTRDIGSGCRVMGAPARSKSVQ